MPAGIPSGSKGLTSDGIREDQQSHTHEYGDRKEQLVARSD